MSTGSTSPTVDLNVTGKRPASSAAAGPFTIGAGPTPSSDIALAAVTAPKPQRRRPSGLDDSPPPAAAIQARGRAANNPSGELMDQRQLTDAVRSLLAQREADLDWSIGMDTLVESLRVQVGHVRQKVRLAFKAYNDNFTASEQRLDDLVASKVDAAQAAATDARLTARLDELASFAELVKIHSSDFGDTLQNKLTSAEAQFEAYARDLKAKLQVFEAAVQEGIAAAASSAGSGRTPAGTASGLLNKLDELKTELTAKVDVLEQKAKGSHDMLTAKNVELLQLSQANHDGLSALELILNQHALDIAVLNDELSHLHELSKQSQAPLRQPPGHEAHREEAKHFSMSDDVFQKPQQDPWGRARAGTSEAADESRPAVGVPPDAARASFAGSARPTSGTAPEGNTSGPDRISRWRSPFDRKEAKDLAGYNGKDKCDVWRRRTSYYLMSKVPDIKPLLEWAERQPDTINNEDLRINAELIALRNTGRLSVDPEIISFHGFLNLNLTDYAWEIFEGCKEENGLEVWRRSLVDETKKTPAELLTLEKHALSPPVCLRLQGLPQAIVRWEAAVKTYHEALPAGSTERLSEGRQVNSLMRILPWSIQERALWDVTKFHTTDALKTWVRERLRSTTAWRGLGQRAEANLVDDEEELTVEEMKERGVPEDEILAVTRQRAARQRPRPPRRAPAYANGKVICFNCGEEGRDGTACTRPKVDPKDRRCFLCNKKGHRAFMCPEKRAKTQDAGAARASPESATTPKERKIFCLECEGGDNIPWHRIRKPTSASTNTTERLNVHDASEPGTVPQLSPIPGSRYGHLVDDVQEYPECGGADSQHRPRMPILADFITEKPQKKMSKKERKAATMAKFNEINFLESTDEDVMNMENEPEFLDFEVALDSACGAHVADKADLPNYVVEESEGSRRGQNFVAAGGKSIANEGQSTVALLTAENSKLETEIQSTFQIAAVTRPLWSLSEIMDNLPEDHDARFTRRFAHVRDGHGTPIALFERKGGLYVSRMRLRNPKHPGFGRQA